MGEYVKQQHYVPQFALKKFQNKNGKIPYAIFEENKLRLCFAPTEKLMQERDFYEIKTEDGKYIRRNSLEDSYAYFEDNIAPNFNYLFELISKQNFQKEFINLVKTNRWAEVEASLLFYMHLLLIRGKKAKEILASKKFTPEITHIMYLLATTSKNYTAEYAKEMFFGEELEKILLFIREGDEENPVSVLLKHLMENYQIKICMTKGEKKLFLSDNPVIIKKFEGNDYVLPISPDVCIMTIPIRLKADGIQTSPNPFFLEDSEVEKINNFSIKNTDKILIVSNEKDVEHIKSLILQ